MVLASGESFAVHTTSGPDDNRPVLSIWLKGMGHGLQDLMPHQSRQTASRVYIPVTRSYLSSSMVPCLGERAPQDWYVTAVLALPDFAVACESAELTGPTCRVSASASMGISHSTKLRWAGGLLTSMGSRPVSSSSRTTPNAHTSDLSVRRPAQLCPHQERDLVWNTYTTAPYLWMGQG